MDKGFAAVMMWFLRRVSIDVYCKSVIETLENGALQLAGGGDEIFIPSNQRSQYYNHHQTANKQTNRSKSDVVHLQEEILQGFGGIFGFCGSHHSTETSASHNFGNNAFVFQKTNKL